MFLKCSGITAGYQSIQVGSPGVFGLKVMFDKLVDCIYVSVTGCGVEVMPNALVRFQILS